MARAGDINVDFRRISRGYSTKSCTGQLRMRTEKGRTESGSRFYVRGLASRILWEGPWKSHTLTRCRDETYIPYMYIQYCPVQRCFLVHERREKREKKRVGKGKGKGKRKCETGPCDPTAGALAFPGDGWRYRRSGPLEACRVEWRHIRLMWSPAPTRDLVFHAPASSIFRCPSLWESGEHSKGGACRATTLPRTDVSRGTITCTA
jgi:hypothetical protein